MATLPFRVPEMPIDPPEGGPVYDLQAKAKIVLVVPVFHDFEGRDNASVNDVLHETLEEEAMAVLEKQGVPASVLKDAYLDSFELE